MDYKKADRIQKKSIIELTKEIGLDEDKGLIAAYGSAISEKFKAKATRAKRTFDPLNFLSMLTPGSKESKGERWIYTKLARMFGGDDDKIEYFGGRARRNKRKDPKYTNISAGQVRSVRVGDGVADIIAKMYNFMMKAHDEEKLRLELENDFRQQDAKDDERRHRAIVNAIKKYKVGGIPGKKDEESSGEGLAKFLGGLVLAVKKWAKDLIDGLWTAIKWIGEKLLKLLKNRIPGIGKIPMGANKANPADEKKNREEREQLQEDEKKRQSERDQLKEDGKKTKVTEPIGAGAGRGKGGNDGTTSHQPFESKSKTTPDDLRARRAARMKDNVKRATFQLTKDEIEQKIIQSSGKPLMKTFVGNALKFLQALNTVPGIALVTGGAFTAIDIYEAYDDYLKQKFDPSNPKNNEEIFKQYVSEELGALAGMVAGTTAGAAIGGGLISPITGFLGGVVCAATAFNA